jgi:predicted ATPase/DNA-binding SARP family transcriptional activator/class 3 adenylate cyclase
MQSRRHDGVYERRGKAQRDEEVPPNAQRNVISPAVTVPERAASPLTLRLFGPFEVCLNGAPLPRLRSRKGQWLLALLALRLGREVERGGLAGTLWPESSEALALASLRMSLANLRQALGSEAGRLRSPTPHTLCLDLAGAEADAAAFDEAIAQGDTPSLEKAVALYRGPLLEGWVEEWAFQERQVREQAFLATLEKLAAQALAAGDPGAAERYLRSVVAEDPLRETAQRALMQSLAASGNYAAALLAYRELRLRLHRELNAEPDAETQAPFQQLRAEARRKAGEGRQGTGVSKAGGGGGTAGRDLIGTDSRPLASAPSGTVTFLFTDIEGSVRHWEADPEAMSAALARHDALLRQAIEVQGGVVFKRVGDAVCAAFATAPPALAAALAGQRVLLGSSVSGVGGRVTDDGSPPLPPTPDTLLPLKVRMALHTGVAEEREGDYFGPSLNRISRLLEIGHGGQVLLSQTACELVRDHLPEGADLRDLGEYRLRDLVRPERVFQLLAADLPADFPPLRSLEAFRHNLPVQWTSFIGREAEMNEVKRLLLPRDERKGIRDEEETGRSRPSSLISHPCRLLTLTGAGGCGKTRLALQVAADLLDEFADGIIFVDLAPIRDPSLVLSTIAHTLGVREMGGTPLVDSLKAHLREKQLLLVLDNFEQVLPAATLVAELLAAASRLKVLVTSRAALRLNGEREFPVPPLAVPGPRQLPALEVLSQYAAVALFIQRAQAVKPGFAVTNENAPAVAEICHRLDGLPLAIELAAARVKLFPPQSLLGRLGSRFTLLTGGARDLPERQQTLRAAIDWSYDLLTPAEQQFFRRFAVFAGGCTPEAVEVVCDGDGALECDPLDGLETLASHSLVRQEEGGVGEPRFMMLETIREYARERLHDSGEAETIQGHHTRFFLQVLESAAPHLQSWTAEERLWIDRLERDHGNLRSALDDAEQGGEIETAVRMATVLWRFWYVRGYWSEGQERLNRLLDLTATPQRAAQRARLLSALARFAYWQANSARARELGEQSLALLRGLGDPREIAGGLGFLAMVARRQEDYAACQSLLEEQLSIWLKQGNQPAQAGSLWRLAQIAHRGGNETTARSFWEECLAIQRQRGTKEGVAVCLQSLGAMAFRQGDADRAWPLYEESLQILRELKNSDRIAFLLCELEKFALLQGRQEAARKVHLALLEVVGHLAEERSVRVAALLSDLGQTLAMTGDHPSARDFFATSLAIAREVDYKGGITWQLANLGETAVRLGDWNAARAFLEEALPLARENGKRLVVARILQDLGTVASLEGKHEEAARLYFEAVALASTEGMDSINRTILLFCLEGQARLAVAERRWQQGALLFGAAEALRQHLGEDRFFADLVDNSPYITTLRNELSQKAFKAAWMQGQEMPLERALQCMREQPGGASNWRLPLEG